MNIENKYTFIYMQSNVCNVYSSQQLWPRTYKCKTAVYDCIRRHTPARLFILERVRVFFPALFGNIFIYIHGTSFQLIVILISIILLCRIHSIMFNMHMKGIDVWHGCHQGFALFCCAPLPNPLPTFPPLRFRSASERIEPNCIVRRHHFNKSEKFNKSEPNQRTNEKEANLSYNWKRYFVLHSWRCTCSNRRQPTAHTFQK